MIQLFLLYRLWRLVRFLWLLALVMTFGKAVFAEAGGPPMIDPARMLATDPGAARISVTLANGIGSNRDLASKHLRDVRTRMFNDAPVTLDDLRALADAGDGHAALRLLKAHADRGIVPRASSQAHYYALAAATGRVAGLRGLIDVLPQIDPDTADPLRMRRFRDILVAYAMAGNTQASAAIVTFHETRRPFGPMDDAIATLAQAGNPTIALTRAMQTMQTGWQDPHALEQAAIYLKLATNSPSLRAQVFADTMLSVLNDQIASLTETERVPKGAP